MATLKRNDSFNFFVFFRKASGGKNENFRLVFPLNETLPPGENPKSLLLSVPYPKQELFHSSELYSFQFTFDGSCGISLYISLTSIVAARRSVEKPQCTPSHRKLPIYHPLQISWLPPPLEQQSDWTQLFEANLINVFRNRNFGDVS